ncbi:hypothetical protein CVT25_010830 [Psilocybe cyanescens]|uniref:Uncharacterized protein n=1 Tax=Psilocybe cyanescens TaxID=93625 RepID=A0A409WF60_PSICY|nr:hypothetical protein CVT25_010830 [Psilocybe cyanescens]
MAVLSRLVPSIASAYGLQAVFALIFVPQQNEKYYDFGGAVGWLSTTFLSLYYPALKAKYWNGVPGSLPALSSFAPRQLLISAAVGIWAVRLGSFLAMRAIKAGGDSRFDEIKKSPRKFTYYWMAQATWITLVGLPVYLVNVFPSRIHPALGARDYLAVGLYASSLLFEVIADRQKSTWRKAKNNKEHDEEFISSGLWGISRHPNYLGEVGIWTGIWALSTSSLQTAAYPRGAVAVSGVPPLERAGDKKFAGNPKWQIYKNSVPIFWPWGPTK